MMLQKNIIWKKVKKKLWEEFEKHYLIENSNIEFRTCQNFKLLEEGAVGNYSSFPHAMDIWNDLSKYITDFITKNGPKENSAYGEYYEIKIPKDFTKYRFWDALDFTVILVLNGTFKEKINITNRYKNSTEDKEYIKSNKVFKCLKIFIGDYVDKDNVLTDELYLNFMHEMLHAYEDLQRVIKSNYTIEDYNNSTNYYDCIYKRTAPNTNGSKYINRLCTLFHFFNKTEIHAIISEFSAEIQKNDIIMPLTIENIIKSTKSWKYIEDSEYTVNLIKNCDNGEIQQKLIEIFNSHSIKYKVKNFTQLIIFLENKLFHVKQYIFKKVAKIIGDKERNSFTKYIY